MPTSIPNKAVFLTKFAVLLDAGVTPIDAIKTLQENHDTQNTQLATISQGLGQGETIANALQKSQLFDLHTITLIKIAEKAGKISLALSFISENIEKHQSRLQQLKHKLWLPWAVLIIAVFASLVLKVLSQNLTAPSLFSSFIPLFIVALATYLFFLFLQSNPLFWLSRLWGSVFIKNVRYLQWLFEYNWYTQLVWQIEAGINYELAIQNSVGLLNSHRYQQTTRYCQQLLKQGNSLTNALEKSHLLLSSGLKQILHHAEIAGRLESSIKHQLILQEESLDRTTNFIFEWLPRIYYLIMIVIIGGFLF